MLNNFIKEYKQRYDKKFEDTFWGNLKSCSQKLLEPRNHPSIFLKDSLSYLISLEFEPINIAVIGHFSSGKSTFLNTLLKTEILPTGVVPVTAKITTIKFSPLNMVKINHLNGRYEFCELASLGKFVDQRDKMEEIKDIEVYLNNDILKNITFIDTPGLNSRSSSDTNETTNIFYKIGGVLWLSLIDNAARASEIQDILTLPRYLKNNSICLLSQKDRLSKEDCIKTLNYSKETFKNEFLDVIAISSKDEKNGLSDSGFSEVREFLDKLSANKEEFIKFKFGEILETLVKEREFYVKLYIKLEKILESSVNLINQKLQEDLKLYLVEFTKIYNWINQASSQISKTFEECVETSSSYYYKQESKTGFFNKKGYSKIEYKSPKFNKDLALSKLIYNDDKLLSSFRIFRRKLNTFENEILDNLKVSYKNLENEILLFKGEYETMKKGNELCSDVENSYATNIVSKMYELFLKEYERSFFKISQSIIMFFEKIDIRIFKNYENAIKLSANFIEDKVLKSIEDYESDPLTFSLFYPKFEDFNSVMLKNFSYYEFEDDLVGNQPFIKKIIEKFAYEIDEILNQNKDYITILKQRHEDIKNSLNLACF